MNTILLLLVGLLLAPPLAAQNNPNPDAESNSSASPTEQMEMLAERSLKLGMKTLIEKGQIYPFAEVMLKNGETRFIARKNDGKPLEPLNVWTKKLIGVVRKSTLEDASIVAAAVTRLHGAKDQDGNPLPGLWTLVDHRNHHPYVLFIPLVKQENGKYKPGTPQNSTAEDWLFKPKK